MSEVKNIKIGIIGGGLMGRESASAFARWCSLVDMPVKPELIAVADPNPQAREWFSALPGVQQLTHDAHELLANPDVDLVYVAVPHMLHEELYTAALSAGKDMLAEKPFGIDLAAARRIRDRAKESGCFVRCCSEFPFLPGVQRAVDYIRSGECGRILEVVSGFHHSSDLDPDKPANWKRHSATCGEIGVLGDLGMHACHIPLRLGWRPKHLFAQLQKGFPTRPDGRGERIACDTYDNALLHTWISPAGQSEPVPMRLEMKRLAPGETNTWFLDVLGTEGGVRFSTSEPKTLWTFKRGDNQVWQKTVLGFDVPFKTITGGIFEVGFPDIIQQMWAAFLLEREGHLGDRFGCATPDEAVASQEIFSAALTSHTQGTVVEV